MLESQHSQTPFIPRDKSRVFLPRLMKRPTVRPRHAKCAQCLPAGLAGMLCWYPGLQGPNRAWEQPNRPPGKGLGRFVGRVWASLWPGRGGKQRGRGAVPVPHGRQLRAACPSLAWPRLADGSAARWLFPGEPDPRELLLPERGLPSASSVQKFAEDVSLCERTHRLLGSSTPALFESDLKLSLKPRAEGWLSFGVWSKPASPFAATPRAPVRSGFSFLLFPGCAGPGCRAGALPFRCLRRRTDAQARAAGAAAPLRQICSRQPWQGLRLPHQHIGGTAGY